MSDEMINTTKSFPKNQVPGIGETNTLSEEFDMNKLNNPVSKSGK